MLRKDFVVEPYQLLEARAAGADLVLLIVAALDDDALQALHDHARELGLTALVEVHDEPEAERALAVGARLVGRQRPQPEDPRGRPRHLRQGRARCWPASSRVAESGIAGPADVRRFVGEGADVVLVGEALVQDGDPEAAVRGDDRSAA